MKSYTITVNGTSYEVTVEEGAAGASSAQTVAKAPAKKAPAAPAKKAVSGSEGAVKINSPMPGKILAVKAGVGTAVKKGDVIILLEAMKMENEIVASQDGTIASVVGVGENVEAGDVLATLN